MIEGSQRSHIDGEHRASTVLSDKEAAMLYHAHVEVEPEKKKIARHLLRSITPTSVSDCDAIAIEMRPCTARVFPQLDH